jgi:transcription termination factor Rho
MVLADLKAMAAQLGIKGTSGLRKGDLVSAIASHQNSAGPQAPASQGRGQASATASKSAPARGADTPVADGHGASSPAGSSVRSSTPTPPPALDLDLPQRPARRRSAGRAEGAPIAQAGAPDDRSATAPTGPTATSTVSEPAIELSHTDDRRPTHNQPSIHQSPSDQGSAGDAATGHASGGASDQADSAANSGERQDRQASDGDDGPRSSRRNRRNRRDRDGRSDGTSGDGQTAAAEGARDSQPTTPPQGQNGQNRDAQAHQSREGQNPRNSRDSRQGQDRNTNQDSRQGQDRNGNQDRNGGLDGDDDSRRGRRFRDRNRRTRDRFADAPTDTEVRDDDVLVPVAGIVDVLDSYAFIRTSGYLSGPNDVYVSLSQIRKNGLRRGDAVTGAVRAPREGESAATRQKFNALVRLDSVNGQDPELAKDRPEFTKLTPLYPNERLRLETESHILTTRIIDLVMPVGKGQRALIVSPPKAGKTSILQAVANAITTNNPEVHLMVVLVDERPEEVTDMQRSVKGEVIASTFDRPPADHTMVAELSIERAKRLVEMGRDVVVLLDSITRLGRAYNLAAPASGRILSGGVDSTALFPPKRFLGAARNIENGGSLTIFASALVETGSAGDTVIFEEFKGTGNAELKLDRRIADKRIFPAIDVDQSSTRKEDLLLSPDELAITVKLRRVLSALDSQQALELLLDRLRKTKSNVEFLMQVAKTTSGV